MTRIVDKNDRGRESDEERLIANDLAELQLYLEHLSVKYPDESIIESSIEQLRTYVPTKKRYLHYLYSVIGETIYRIFPLQRSASFSLFLLGSLLLPNKLY